MDSHEIPFKLERSRHAPVQMGWWTSRVVQAQEANKPRTIPKVHAEATQAKAALARRSREDEALHGLPASGETPNWVLFAAAWTRSAETFATGSATLTSAGSDSMCERRTVFMAVSG
jgi:hypothetical protein